MLYGLLALAIPIIIHLFNFRRYKKLYFSNIQFLKNITQETRKQNKLKHLIVLLLRLLAIASLVLAFADPVFKDDDTLTKKADDFSYIYIDNSFSMRAQGNNGRLFDQAIHDAKKMVEAAKRDHRFVLLTNEVNTGQSKTISKDLMLNALDMISIDHNRRHLSAVLKTIRKAAEQDDLQAWNAFLFSDFQKSSTDFDKFPADSSGMYYFVPARQANVRNVFIDTCWMDVPLMLPERRGQLKVRVVNASDIDYEKLPLQLFIDGQKKAVAGVDLKANARQLVHMDFTFGEAGWHAGLLEIEDFPIRFDDKLYFSYEVMPAIKVLEIYADKGSDELSSFYMADSLFDFETIHHKRIDYNKLKDYHLILLNGLPSYSSGLQKQIRNYVEQGGNLVFLPEDSESVGASNQLLSYLNAGKIETVVKGRNRVVSVKEQHELFKDAITLIPDNPDLPVLQRYMRYSYTINSGIEPLIHLLNGDVFLYAKKLGLGNFYALAVNLDPAYGNFSNHELFVPIMYGAALAGNRQTGFYHEVGQHAKMALSKDIKLQDEQLSVNEIGSDYSFIPSLEYVNAVPQLSFYDAITTDGFYNLKQDTLSKMLFAFNYPREESLMEFYDETDLTTALLDSPLTYTTVIGENEDTLHEVINTRLKQPAFWKLFIIFALLILLAEVLILRLWR